MREAAAEGNRLHGEWNRTGIGLRGKALAALIILSRCSILRHNVFQPALRSSAFGFRKSIVI
jgi:hypothetical protein